MMRPSPPSGSSLTKAMLGEEKPGHKYSVRTGVPGHYKYQYQTITTETKHLDALAAKAIHDTLSDELRHGGDLGIHSIVYLENPASPRTLFVARPNRGQLCYTRRCGLASLHLRVREPIVTKFWVGRTRRLSEPDAQRTLQLLQRRDAAGLTQLPDTVQYLSAPVDLYDRKEILRRGVIHEAGHFRWLRIGYAARQEFSLLLQNADNAAQLPSYYALADGVGEAFAECYVVHRLGLLDNRGRIAMSVPIQKFFAKIGV